MKKFLREIKEIWLKSWREAQQKQEEPGSFVGDLRFDSELEAKLIRGKKPKWYQRKRVTRHA